MSDWRHDVHAGLERLWTGDAGERRAAAQDLLAPEAVWHVARPVGDLVGREAILEGWFAPLHGALPGLMRREEIVMGGTSRTGSGRFLACLGHCVANFAGTFHGIGGHGKLVFLRLGAFYRVVDGRVVEAFVLPDLPDLMRQVGRMPFPALLGTEMLFPGPATQDGVLPGHSERSDASAALVEAMLGDLRAFDPANFESAGQTGTGGYWHRDMLWYGPCGIGANVTYAGFQRDHRIPFLTAFPDRVGGNHFARFGDGDFVCSGGWPSMTMTHRGPYLGVAPTDRAMTLRVMDFWRCEAGQIRENWVLLDMVDLFAQMGVDVLAPG